MTGERTGYVLAGVVGIIGALLGGWLAKVLFHIHSLNTFFNLSTWVTAIVGAVVLLLIVRAATDNRSRGRGSRGRTRSRRTSRSRRRVHN